MTQNKEQFVKALPYGEIELHGDDETIQCIAGDITAMKIHFLDGMEFKHVDGECKQVQAKPPCHILVVIIGRDYGEHYAERMTFSAPTEEEVEVYRDQINKIRYSQTAPRNSVGIWEKLKRYFGVR